MMSAPAGNVLTMSRLPRTISWLSQRLKSDAAIALWCKPARSDLRLTSDDSSRLPSSVNGADPSSLSLMGASEVIRHHGHC